MINFACKCGHRFSVAEDRAGGCEQCPECKLLVDVPYLSDVANLEEDGTYKVGEGIEPEKASEEFQRAYFRRRVDEDGGYDLRPTPEQIMDAGVEEIPLKPEEEDRPGVLKYDPETGELIRPMRLKQDDGPRPEEIPVAKPALGYATGYAAEGEVRWWMVPLALLRPANIAVVAVVFVMHVVNQVFVAAVAGGLFFLGVAPLLVFFMIFAHYSNVIDDIGRMDRDELPGVMRGMSWTEDIWHPFVGLAAALMICYLPAGLAFNLAPKPLDVALGLGLGGVGTLLFPAVLLTTATSGSMLNLRPDRVLAVIGICWGAYLPVVVIWVAAAVIYGASLGLVTAQAATVTRWGGSIRLPAPAIVFYGGLFAGVYLMHLFAWYLGLMYRKHQPQFPWVLQRHEWSLKDEEELRALREERRRRARRVPPGASGSKGEEGPVVRAVPIVELHEEGAPAEAEATDPKLAGARARLMQAMDRSESARRSRSVP